MGGKPSLKDFRRSTRIACSIPVEVSGLNAGGQEVHEKTTSNLVNKHGACISVQHQFSLGSQVVVRVPHTERQQRCRVAWVSGGPRAGGIYQIGVEMEHAENIWGVLFPPEDWGAS
ncbi:MAG: PilZ domain-containing protein [Acidobacteria bacterium]|nr:PilZ domain-containing protein [Acidobacteriota bacterium]